MFKLNILREMSQDNINSRIDPSFLSGPHDLSSNPQGHVPAVNDAVTKKSFNALLNIVEALSVKVQKLESQQAYTFSAQQGYNSYTDSRSNAALGEVGVTMGALQRDLEVLSHINNGAPTNPMLDGPAQRQRQQQQLLAVSSPTTVSPNVSESRFPPPSDDAASSKSPPRLTSTGTTLTLNASTNRPHFAPTSAGSFLKKMLMEKIQRGQPLCSEEQAMLNNLPASDNDWRNCSGLVQQPPDSVDSAPPPFHASQRTRPSSKDATSKDAKDGRLSSATSKDGLVSPDKSINTSVSESASEKLGGSRQATSETSSEPALEVFPMGPKKKGDDDDDDDDEREIKAGNRRVRTSWKLCRQNVPFVTQIHHDVVDSYVGDECDEDEARKQVDILMLTLDDSLKILGKPGALVEVTQRYGAQMQLYGLTEDQLQVREHVLLSSLAEHHNINSDDIAPWTQELNNDWNRVLKLLHRLLVQGFSSPEGVANLEKYNKRVLEALHTCWKSLLDNQHQQKLSYIQLMYDLGVRKSGKGWGVKFTNLLTRGRPIAEAFSNIFEHGVQDRNVIRMLQEIGARHIAYGVQTDDFEAFEDVFVEAIRQQSAEDTCGSFVCHHLRLAYRASTAILIDSMHDAMNSFGLRHAPRGCPFTLVMTDIEKSTLCWNDEPIAMQTAVDMHQKVIRRLIQRKGGFEVKTVGDSFIVAFTDIYAAFVFALLTQLHLLCSPVDGFNMVEENLEGLPPLKSTDVVVWNPHTLRVRIGVHWCMDATAEFDTMNQHFDYFGNDVNKAARIADAACGGQTVCTSETLQQLLTCERINEENDSVGSMMGITVDGNPTAHFLDVVQYKKYRDDFELACFSEKVDLVSVYPSCLAARRFGERAKKH